MTGGEYKTGEQGQTILDVPDATATNPVDSLKADPAYIERYLNGDPAAINQMSQAVKGIAPALEPATPASAEPQAHYEQQQPEQSGDVTAQADIQLDFSAFKDADTEVLVEANKLANDLAFSLQAPKELVAPVFNRLVEVNAEYGGDPERDAESRLEALHKELERKWGDNYQSRMDSVVQVLNDHPELDEILYDTGAWSDVWTIETLANVANGGL
jgi:hypothetical protein